MVSRVSDSHITMVMQFTCMQHMHTRMFCYFRCETVVIYEAMRVCVGVFLFGMFVLLKLNSCVLDVGSVLICSAVD